mgnify:CR=1 FL=1
MSVIGKTTLIETIPIAKKNPFYGEYFKKNTFTEEYIMEKFQDMACPNQGIEVGFKHGNATYVLQANKYAFIDISNGIFEILFNNNNLLYELDIKVDDNGDIDFDNAVTITISVKDEDGLGEIIAEVKADYIKPFE